jgi:hypothetical protein
VLLVLPVILAFSLDSELQPSAFNLSQASAIGKSSDNAPAFWTARGPPPFCNSDDMDVILKGEALVTFLIVNDLDDNTKDNNAASCCFA